MAVAIYHHYDETPLPVLIRWAAVGVCIAAAHGGLAWAALNWPRPAIAAGEPPAAVMIELAPLPAAPETPPNEIAIGPQMVVSEATTPVESKDKPVEHEEPEPETPPETVSSVVKEPKPEVKTEIELPRLPEITSSVAVLAPSPPPPPQEKKVEERERKPAKPKKVERKKPQDRASPNAPTTAAPQAVNAPRASTNAAPTAGASSSMSPATWRSALMAHLNRHKRFPAGGSRGVSQVAFTIDRTGRVLSARLIGSSGDAALDQEAVALTHRASPVPPPPPDVGGGNVTLAVPVRFSE